MITNCLLDVIFLKFYFVAFQYLCHVEDVDRHLRYPPVEMALMEYSLKEGRQKVWHTLIHPGEEGYHIDMCCVCTLSGTH